MAEHIVYGAATFPVSVSLFVAPIIFFSLPVTCCLLLPSPGGPLAAGVLATAALLPRLLWWSSKPAEGTLFSVANLIYWNFVYPAFFGSPLVIGALCYLVPRVFLPLVALYVLYIKVLSRPDLKDGSGWQYFSQHDWGIVALRHFLRLKLHVSSGLRNRDPSKPVVIGIHP